MLVADEQMDYVKLKNTHDPNKGKPHDFSSWMSVGIRLIELCMRVLSEFCFVQQEMCVVMCAVVMYSPQHVLAFMDKHNSCLVNVLYSASCPFSLIQTHSADFDSLNICEVHQQLLQ